MFLIHLLEIDTRVPDGKGGARRCTYGSLGLSLLDQLASQLAVTALREVQWLTISFMVLKSDAPKPSIMIFLRCAVAQVENDRP